VLDIKYKESDRYLTKEGTRPNSVGLVFLSYRGMTTDSKGNPYPLGTPDVRDGQQVVVGTKALTLAGRHGSWRNDLRAYYYFRDQTQPITQPLLLPVSILAQLELDQLVWLSLDDHIRRSYLISKVQAQSPGIDGKVSVRLDVLSLPSGIELGGDQDAPVVWVEFIYGPETIVSNPLREYTVLSVKFWSDKAKTQPAIVTNLPINLRFKKSHLNTSGAVLDYLEYGQTYQGNGVSTVLETAFLFNYRETATQYYNSIISIDPGEGYSILP
jgi:hypothetical protein